MDNVAKRGDPGMNLRMPPDLFEAVSKSAARNGRSRNSHVVYLLRKALVQEAANEGAKG